MNVGVVWILGGGPAGSAAAIAALSEGRQVRILEKSRLPRHKVCGEFFSPEIFPMLERLGAWRDFWVNGPAIIRRLILHFGANEAGCNLPDEGFGLSRYRFDHLLFNRAVTLGGVAMDAQAETALEARVSLDLAHPVVWALGRKAKGPRGKRLFGFKAHFRGPANDVVELFFRAGSYAGVSPVEDGITNVCGLAPEDLLARYDFEIDEFTARFEILARRLAPLTRLTKWFLTGPLAYGEHGPIPPDVYPAGDTFAFLDPFLGSGLVNAVATGRSAGVAAARGVPPGRHAAECHRLLRRPLYLARFFRTALERGLAERLGWLVPAGLLFRATRLTTSGHVGRWPPS